MPDSDECRVIFRFMNLINFKNFTRLPRLCRRLGGQANLFVDFVFPQSCFVCGEPGVAVCRGCLRILPRARLKCLKCGRRNPLGTTCVICRNRNSPDKVLAVFDYDGPIREMIHLFKYEDASSYASIFGEALTAEFEKLGAKDAVIVPVPLSRKRKAWRGYNQSLLLARIISGKTGLKIREVLERKKTPFYKELFSHPESQVQSGTREKRLANVRGKFEAVKPVPENVVLIDDVITSGATVLEATRVLKRAGAKKVYVLALAMG